MAVLTGWLYYQGRVKFHDAILLETEILSSLTFLHVHHCTIMFMNFEKKKNGDLQLVCSAFQPIAFSAWETTLEKASAVLVFPFDSRKHKTSSRQDIASQYEINFGTLGVVSS